MRVLVLIHSLHAVNLALQHSARLPGRPHTMGGCEQSGLVTESLNGRVLRARAARDEYLAGVDTEMT